MASVRFADAQSRPTAFLDLTSLTLDELPQLIPSFEAAFHAPMQADNSMIPYYLQREDMGPCGFLGQR